jgi:hypothetical protein
MATRKMTIDDVMVDDDNVPDSDSHRVLLNLEVSSVSYETTTGNDIAAESQRVFNLPTGFYLPGVAEPEEITPLTEGEQAAVDMAGDSDALFRYAAQVINKGPGFLEEMDRLQEEGTKELESGTDPPAHGA